LIASGFFAQSVLRGGTLTSNWELLPPVTYLVNIKNWQTGTVNSSGCLAARTGTSYRKILLGLSGKQDVSLQALFYNRRCGFHVSDYPTNYLN
jgi:hypothetical protein